MSDWRVVCGMLLIKGVVNVITSSICRLLKDAFKFDLTGNCPVRGAVEEIDIFIGTVRELGEQFKDSYSNAICPVTADTGGRYVIDSEKLFMEKILVAPELG